MAVLIDCAGVKFLVPRFDPMEEKHKLRLMIVTKCVRHPHFGSSELGDRSRLCVVQVPKSLVGDLPRAGKSDLWCPGCFNDGLWIETDNHLLLPLTGEQKRLFNGTWDKMESMISDGRIPTPDLFPKALL